MIDNFYSGKFIVIEGLDGSGQSTQVSRLAEFLGSETVITKEPTGDSESGRKIRKILGEHIEIDPSEFQKLYVQDRKEHLDNLIIPALEQGKIVISDRYFFSTFAFGTAHGSNLEQLIELNNNFLYPDITFLLKVSPEICIKRIEKRGSHKDLFEKEEKLSKVWDVYKILPLRFKNIHVIDGEQSVEEVFEQIKSKYETIY
ncbi:dTMP kinase [Patescibacteria group bacterium]|nr:dTMP kinase [Patescibacteria group bacterium]